MTSWDDVTAAAPDLARRAKAAFDRGRHKTMATLRRDGSPRISGTEVEFRDGEVWVGSMLGAQKARDLLRDPRVAIHSPTSDPDEETGTMEPDARISGRAVEVTDPETLAAASGGEPPSEPYHLFRIDVTEVVVIGVGDPPDHLDIDHWTPAGGLQHTERK